MINKQTNRKLSLTAMFIPIALLIVCGALVMRGEILGRGNGMWAGYPIGFFIQLFFGAISLWAAGYVGNKPATALDNLWVNLLRLASIFASIDLVWMLSIDMIAGRFVLAGLVHLALAALIFRSWGIRVIWVVVFTFPVKAIGLLMLDTTLYTIF